MPKKRSNRRTPSARTFGPAAAKRLGRACADLPFETIARAVEMNRETVRRQLRGRSALSAELLARVCRLLDLSADDVLFRGRRW
jgi:hypothetical protein